MRWLAVLLTVLCAAACAHQMNPNVTSAEAAYQMAQSDPTVASRGQVQLYEARKDLDQAVKSFNDGDDKDIVDHYAYLAQRRVDIARATADKDVAQQRVETLGAQRDAVVLDARTREAEAARERAAVAESTSQQLREELVELQAKDTNRGQVITLQNDVLFDVDRSDIKPGAMSELQRVASVLNQEPGRRVRVEGHADSTGNDAHNLELSQRRAHSVASALIQDGVAPSRVSSEGFGESEPVASNATPEGRQQNRRVEVVVMQPGQ
jgi:outer membrane protein OmpA-like peptidoglycan-associated protein